MIINRQVLTLDEFTIQQYRNYPGATGELSSLLRDIGLAAKRVNVEVNKAGLVDILGDAGSINVQGEEVKKLDVFANNQFTGVLKHVNTQHFFWLPFIIFQRSCFYFYGFYVSINF